jgi:hypothetical protein
MQGRASFELQDRRENAELSIEMANEADLELVLERGTSLHFIDVDSRPRYLRNAYISKLPGR